MVVAEIVDNTLHFRFRSVDELLKFMTETAASKDPVAIPGGGGMRFSLHVGSFNVVEACAMAEIGRDTLTSWAVEGFPLRSGKRRLPRLPDVARFCLMRELTTSGVPFEMAAAAAARISRNLLPHVLRCPKAVLRAIKESETGRFRKSRADPDLVELCLSHFLPGPHPWFAVLDIQSGKVEFRDSAARLENGSGLALDLKELGGRLASHASKEIADIIILRPTEERRSAGRKVVFSVD